MTTRNDDTGPKTDTGPDTGPDTGAKPGPETGLDTESRSGPDTGADTGPETGSETGQPEERTPRGPGGLAGILANCRLGLRVLADELRWLVTSGLRGYESRQVRRRLEAEYAALGRLARAHLAPGDKAPLSADGEAGIVMGQIDFLEQELEFMADDMRRTRKEMLARRRREMDPDDN
ncbi:hypothetical protein [Desulfocurvus sp.]|uniref:hypothetical protein n=1 Tax=Desulfocurvus sp. TaxID=2871698 RepID=UPI0025C311FD|nr:hypothetical protein [Desulfocurvus sp.]